MLRLGRSVLGLLFPHINIVPETHVAQGATAGVGGVVVSPVVLVPGDELLQTALHDAGDPVSLADIAHEFDRNCLGSPDQGEDQDQEEPHFHVVPFTPPSPPLTLRLLSGQFDLSVHTTVMYRS